MIMRRSATAGAAFIIKKNPANCKLAFSCKIWSCEDAFSCKDWNTGANNDLKNYAVGANNSIKNHAVGANNNCPPLKGARNFVYIKQGNRVASRRPCSQEREKLNILREYFAACGNREVWVMKYVSFLLTWLYHNRQMCWKCVHPIKKFLKDYNLAVKPSH